MDYYALMKPDAKTLSPFAKFTLAMDHLMTVPHSEIKAKLDAEKRARTRKRKAKKPSAVHAVSAKD